MSSHRTVPMRDDAWRAGGDNLAPTPVTDWPQPWLGRLLLVSLLVMLNLPMTFTLITRTDPYGFFTLKSVSAYPLPLVLSTGLSSALALVGYVCYRWLRGRQRWFTGGRWSPLTRGAVLCAPPVLLAYLPIIVLSSHGWKPTHLALGAVIAGALTVIHALRDSEMSLDPAQARYWFICALGSILVFLVLCIGAMVVLYEVKQFPASGNMLWTWEYRWSELGYPPEEYDTWHRDGLLAFTAIGVAFMIAALGGSMLGSILRWIRADAPSAYVKRPEAPEWAAAVLHQLWEMPAPAPTDTAYSASFGGSEVVLSKKQYALLVGSKEDLLYEADLIIDKVTGSVLKRTQGGWSRINFRSGETCESRRSGPFLLLCIYASHPGKRFTNAELRGLLQEDLPDRPALNVTDFFNQLRKKRPSLPVARYGDSTYLPESFKVCLLANSDVPRKAPIESTAEGESATA